ncbi:MULTISPECIES: ADP-ribosyl-(dinitrogen reductase) hydrolase [Pseudoalteromonas]|uniref:ADP-ribosyl-(Dinitrogen reductase) hydrolase n=1 Tax=Pseudoalteromonas arctica TaxID=394751 RepID=A0A7X9YFB3_9GAMM|nr:MULTISPECIES: ADP-ribosyl-(dinitrogen reductase) hydrolase [Pseudoalteromonas]MDN3392830.1 ADP-ribosyl-(dinitrogen reductase) hydrolase [Pseudoalteromonas sp. APC 3691]NMF48180.1 ADP-ribosyl-(dinitrogen reductase) hydrolase [Pseudoalteromonas arctica]|tara:strand:- start:757 stop:1050 length:294 start_codon:yes stop_codon:yes gene_type:complete
MGLQISTSVRHKLATKHSVTESEIIECFSSREVGSKYLMDDRADHKSNPPTLWFIGTTDAGRCLKVVFIAFQDTGDVVIKTAYEANSAEIKIYNEKA